jgi:hypothetical protein
VRRALLVLTCLSAAANPTVAEPQDRGCGLDFLEPDAASDQCLSCHERGSGDAPRFRREATHPFDVRYRSGPLRASRPREGSLRAEALVAAVLRLPGGLVTCTTCHAAVSRLSFRLARSMSAPARNERLCDTCHDLPW